jgi:hypothetical protein
LTFYLLSILFFRSMATHHWHGEVSCGDISALHAQAIRVHASCIVDPAMQAQAKQHSAEHATQILYSQHMHHRLQYCWSLPQNLTKSNYSCTANGAVPTAAMQQHTAQYWSTSS